MSIADRAETVRTVISELDLPPVTLVGIRQRCRGGVYRCPRTRPVHAAVMISATGPCAHLSRGPLQVFARPLPCPVDSRGSDSRCLYALQGFPSYLTDRERALAMLDAAAFDFAEHRRNLAAMRVPRWSRGHRRSDHLDVHVPGAGGHGAGGPRIEPQSGGHNVQKAHAEDLAAALCGSSWAAERLTRCGRPESGGVQRETADAGSK